MRVLVACEFSGVVRRAFRERGHDAWSCDLLSAEDYSAYHHQTDVLKILSHNWDLLIAHPPCTVLCNSGVKWLYRGGRMENGLDMDRWQRISEAAKFVRTLLFAHIERICVEQPIMHGYGSDLVAHKVTQIIQPWQFGHGETKATCLRLKNLPRLRPTNIVEGRKPRVHHEPPSPDRWKNRSRTLPGIAQAMAEQWG